MICSLVAFDPAATGCDDGHFGVFCDGICHCKSGSCDKRTGHCPSGCATGWSGDNCQTGRCHCSVTLVQGSYIYSYITHTDTQIIKKQN